MYKQVKRVTESPQALKKFGVSKKKRMKRNSGRSNAGEMAGGNKSDQKRFVELQAAGSRCRVLCDYPIASSAQAAVKHEPQDVLLYRGILLWTICVQRALGPCN